MTPQELKNSILQLAIQGKLVEQRPEEGTAEELYRQIQVEKQTLIQAGKIKNEKPLSEITDDEKPFDIPESWMWVHLNQIAESSLGKTLDKAKNTGELCPYLCSINVYWKGISLETVKVAKFTEDDKFKYHLNRGDLLICEGGDVGRSAIWNSDEEMYYQNALHRVRFFGGIFSSYFRFVIECYKGIGILDEYSKGMTIKHLVQNSLYAMWLPLPPIAEQKRIVAKIEELMPLIDRYEQAWTRLEDFNKRFPSDMQKSLLQLAISGKLVEQRPEEGTGEELYQKIQTEKQSLIRSGKLKKDKPLPKITEEEKPFDIPESWKWVRIGSIFNLQAGKNITSADIYSEASLEHSYPCYGGDGCRGFVTTYNRSGHYAIIGRQGALCGNVNYASGNFYATEHAVVVEQFAGTSVLWCGYFLIALNLNQYATATAQPGLAVANINQVLIPLPPLAEQKRIVAKLESLLPLCDKLK